MGEVFMANRVRPNGSAPQVASSTSAHPCEESQIDKARSAFLRNPTEQALERICPGAVDLSVEAVTALRNQINGRAPELAGNRGESYFRDMLRCERRFTEGDIARLAIQAPGDLRVFMLPLMLQVAKGAPADFALDLAAVAPTVGCALAPVGEAAGDIERESFEMAAFTLGLLNLVRDVLKDRILDDEERAALLKHIQAGKARLATIETAVLLADRNQERRKVAR